VDTNNHERLFPEDIQAVHVFAVDTLHKLSHLVFTLEETHQQLSMNANDSEWLAQLAEMGTDAVEKLFDSLQVASTSPENIMLELADAFDETPVIQERNWASAHKCVNELATVLLNQIWILTDRESFQNRELYADSVKSKWVTVCQKLFQSRFMPENLNCRDIEIMLSKEALRATRKRQLIPEPVRSPFWLTPEERKEVSKDVRKILQLQGLPIEPEVAGSSRVKPSGVTLRDAALHYCDGDEVEAVRQVKRIHDSKRFQPNSLGKCPHDGRANLYDCRDVVGIFQEFYTLSQDESERLKSSLTAKLRNPK
jgi:hypothetical protein